MSWSGSVCDGICCSKKMVRFVADEKQIAAFASYWQDSYFFSFGC
jgi:hypothetical protein